MSEANKDLVRRHVEEIVAEEYVEHAVAPFGTTAPGTVHGPSAARETAYRIEDGRLCEHWATCDDLSAMLQMGVVKAPGPPAFVRATQRVRGAVRAQA